MITYCVESLASARSELETLLPLHWQEIARDRTDPRFALDPDWDTYHALENLGQFWMMVVRSEGRMIGYLIGFVGPQLHYKASLAFRADIFFLLPEHRKGRIGIELFRQAEKTLRRRGVDKIYLGSKCREDLDRSKLFEHLGYERIEYVFAKVLSD